MVKSLFVVGLGGFVGAVSRFLLTRYIQLSLDSVFPWATLVVNMLGCFLIGIVYGIVERGSLISPEWRIFLSVGLIGGFTTFSTFSNDTFIMLQGREVLKLVFYTFMSFSFGLLAVILGRGLIKLM